jgi:hypothetical protein
MEYNCALGDASGILTLNSKLITDTAFKITVKPGLL